MKMGTSNGALGKVIRAGVAFTFVVGALLLLTSATNPVEPTGTNVQAAWGNESLRTLQAGLDQISPIALANACGLGASSCFKCHNGKRAIAPGSDPAKSPWHVQHREVNNSCAGCHKGNPRIMMKDMAHTRMIASPRSGEMCADCHKNDLGKVEAAYKSVSAGGK